MIRIFIGSDHNETVALNVLAHSIVRHSSVPVSITPLVLSQLPLERRGGSTEFAFSRFLVPWLCDYEGTAIFMDCDMLCRADIAELARYALPRTNAVSVVKHDYMPKPGTKFLGRMQTAYAKKNWSSVMVFNNAKCRVLTPAMVETAPGLVLHQFQWCEEDEVGELDPNWNHLVSEYAPNQDAKLVHWTLGGPWFAAHWRAEFAGEWHDEKNAMLYANPIGEYKKRASG